MQNVTLEVPFCRKQGAVLRLKPCDSTPKATLAERSQMDVGQFLEMLRFENRSKLEELPDVLK